MAHREYIIFLRDKSGNFQLRDNVDSFGYDDRRGKYYVRFKKGENFFYYNADNVDVAEMVSQLEPPFRVMHKISGMEFHRVLGVRVFRGKFKKAYRIIFENGDIKSYPSEYLSVEEHIDDKRSLDVLEYLKEVSKYNVIPLEDDKTISLAEKFSKLSFVPKGSLLEGYLNVNKYDKRVRKSVSPIFPFGCNRSQYKAVRDALENGISVIQGPPGTGKTQTILNIMANLILGGKTMQIVSNNNSAVENVKEKLQTYDLGFICAQLGCSSNKASFIEKQTGVFPDMSLWALPDSPKVRNEAIRLSIELQQLYAIQEKLAESLEILDAIKRQVTDFPIKMEYRGRLSSDTLLRYYFLCMRKLESSHKLDWFTRLRLRFRRLPFGDNAVDELQSLYNSAKVRNLELKCAEYKGQLRDIDGKNKRLRELSMQVLKDYLYRNYGNKKERRVFSSREILLKSADFLKEYPVILSTTFSATSNIGRGCKFDYLIMDEASQVDVAAGALALSTAKNVVVVGDLKQLPNVVGAHTEEITNAIFAKYKIPEAYRYSTNSFLSSICALYPDIPQTLLREHYRCHPLIIGFCSKEFYDGELIPMKKDSQPFAPIRVVYTTKGNHARGTVNLRQVETIVQEIIPELKKRFTDIGVIAPYNNQVSAIKDAFNLQGWDYPVATVHKFQGRENDAIVLSTVDNQASEFINDPHLLNVAVSRAKNQFTLVVSSEEQPDSNIRDLIDYIEYHQGDRNISKVASIYDLLYEDYTKELLDFYKNHRRVSEFDSENLTYWAIREVIQKQRSAHLGIILHYPLRYLLTPSTVLTDEQRTYASHSWTHLDFLIFDKVTHKPRLAIEVDGTQFHRKESLQGHRDSLKDSVLEAVGLRLLRLSTNGSCEKEKIADALIS